MRSRERVCQNNIAAVSALELLVHPLDRIGSRASPLHPRQSREGEEPVAGFLPAVSNGPTPEPPFAQEGPFGARGSPRGRRSTSSRYNRRRSPRAASRVHAPAGCAACEPCSVAPARRLTRRRSPPPVPARRLHPKVHVRTTTARLFWPFRLQACREFGQARSPVDRARFCRF